MFHKDGGFLWWCSASSAIFNRLIISDYASTGVQGSLECDQLIAVDLQEIISLWEENLLIVKETQIFLEYPVPTGCSLNIVFVP